MKPEEAIKQLETIFTFGISNTWKDKEARELAIQDLEKQIPVNPNGYENGGAEDYEEWAECPMCSESIPEYTLENETECYCIGCGQKLKWEVEG